MMSTLNYHYAGFLAGLFAIFILDAGILESCLLYFIVTIQLIISRILYAEKRKKEEE